MGNPISYIRYQNIDLFFGVELDLEVIPARPNAAASWSPLKWFEANKNSERVCKTPKQCRQVKSGGKFKEQVDVLLLSGHLELLSENSGSRVKECKWHVPSHSTAAPVWLRFVEPIHTLSRCVQCIRRTCFLPN